jgi:hypothetical protein
MDEIEAFCNVRCRPLLSKLGRSPRPDSQACTCPIVPHAIGQPASAVPLLARAGAAGRLPLEQRPVAWVADRRGSVPSSSAITGLIVLTPPCHRCVFLLPCPALQATSAMHSSVRSAGRRPSGRKVSACTATPTLASRRSSSRSRSRASRSGAGTRPGTMCRTRLARSVSRSSVGLSLARSRS